MKRDSKGRFTKEEPQGLFRFDIVLTVMVVLTLVFIFGYCLPVKLSEIMQENYDRGFSEGNALGFKEGFKNGQEIQRLVDKEGYHQNWYEDHLYCNETLCKSFDDRYNLRWEFATRIATAITWSW